MEESTKDLQGLKTRRTAMERILAWLGSNTWLLLYRAMWVSSSYDLKQIAVKKREKEELTCFSLSTERSSRA